jgi:hypothetical protein
MKPSCKKLTKGLIENHLVSHLRDRDLRSLRALSVLLVGSAGWVMAGRMRRLA